MERGSHQELVDLKGHYFAMFSLQVNYPDFESKQKNSVSKHDRLGIATTFSVWNFPFKCRKQPKYARANISEGFFEDELRFEEVVKNGAMKLPFSVETASLKYAVRDQDDRSIVDDFQEPLASEAISPAQVVSMYGELLVYSNEKQVYFFFEFYLMKIYLIIGSTMAILNGFSNPCLAILLAIMLPAFYLTNTDQMMNVAIESAYLFCILGFSLFFIITLQKYCFSFIGETCMMKIKLDLFDNLLNQDLAFFEEAQNNPDLLIAKTNENCVVVRRMISEMCIYCTRLF